MSVLEKMVLVERRKEEERSPLNRKWHAVQISGFEKRGKFVHLIPHPDSGITEKELDKKIDTDSMDKLVPASMIMEGGWAILSGANTAEFHTDSNYRQKFRKVGAGTVLSIPKAVLGYRIVDVVKNDSLRNEVTVVCKETAWNITRDVYARLKDKIIKDNWLIVDNRWVIDAWNNEDYKRSLTIDQKPKKEKKEKGARRDGLLLNSFYVVLSHLDRIGDMEAFALVKEKGEAAFPELAWERREKPTVEVNEVVEPSEATAEATEDTIENFDSPDENYGNRGDDGYMANEEEISVDALEEECQEVDTNNT